MDYSPYSDEQVVEEIQRLRAQIERIRVRLESGQGGVDHNDLRARMSEINLLKLEARKRRLPVEG
jgi:hypothetical protein